LHQRGNRRHRLAGKENDERTFTGQSGSLKSNRTMELLRAVYDEFHLALGDLDRIRQVLPMKHSVFLLCLFSSLLGVSVAGAVVSGQPAVPGDFIRRSVVEISGPGCTGIVISDRHVLTAAHCTFSEVSSLVILKASLYQTCSHALVDDVFYPPNEKMVSIDGWNWPAPDLAVLRLQTPLCGARPAVLSSAPLTPGAILRTAGYSEGLWDAREVDWTGIRILPSDMDVLKKLFPNLQPNASQLHQMIQTEVPLFNFARPVTAGAAICKGDSGGPVYSESGEDVIVYGVASGVLSKPRTGNTHCDGSFIELIVPIRPQRDWVLSRIAKPLSS
jgi:hypothetical protein